MNRIVLALMVSLLTAPAWATTVTVWCQQVVDTNQVEIWYETGGTLPRAFALDIMVSDGNIVACEPAMVGESTAAVKGYGIFPGTITIDAAGNVTDYGSPLASPSELPGDTLGGLGTNGITIEIGSLYVGESNAPDPCGLLCTIRRTAWCEVSIWPNVSRAGNGVVMEGSDEIATVNLRTCHCRVEEPYIDCCGQEVPDFYSGPACWWNPGHCRGDANGDCVINAVDVLALRSAWPGFGGPGCSGIPCCE